MNEVIGGGEVALPAGPRRRSAFTDAQVAGIAARVAHAQLPWWRRWLAARPPTWEQTTRRG